jgi:hypothetical protein
MSELLSNWSLDTDPQLQEAACRECCGPVSFNVLDIRYGNKGFASFRFGSSWRLVAFAASLSHHRRHRPSDALRTVPRRL